MRRDRVSDGYPFTVADHTLQVPALLNPWYNCKTLSRAIARKDATVTSAVRVKTPPRRSFLKGYANDTTPSTTLVNATFPRSYPSRLASMVPLALEANAIKGTRTRAQPSDRRV